VGTHIEEILDALVKSVVINHQLNPLNTNPAFRLTVQEGVNRAVREIVLPVVERSVTIASITTRELCTKDFASDPNEGKLRKAAYIAVQKMTGSLALATCK
jgi:CCR4-NOT transcription complex subunit 1